MIPEGASIEGQLEEAEEPSKTWIIDFEAGRVIEMRDGLEAIRQAVFMALSSSRYEHLIYSEEYGSEINKLIGSNPIFIETELRRMIEETLMPDERISGIEDLTVDYNGDRLLARFTVVSSYGNFDAEQVVK
ncbi:DUF2634 domain-containing protein [Paenibacillus thiaminolyticus]|uniref:DUF2634 domain-containing protein n=1 Tax=Paenibacillus TaxID=44249 RepID=UPI000DA8DBEF|nr:MULTISPECIES: DUF2634 domain-containing protein [Paenibacillus]NGP58144.1 DUF2634 domain-containing protein [Paenibacillus thiaminolyticus]NGP60052.1 DUF2634 domain-containing protein [Paenibacillus thiaminolyticus]PZM65338.1 DUF2634 domain-containing protein [Paenibacillus dendritiformis]